MDLKYRKICYIFLVYQLILVNGGIINQFDTWSNPETLDINFPHYPYLNETRCYENLGCLNITRGWYHFVNRPINYFPLPRSEVNTKFLLFTRSNLIEGSPLATKPEIIKASNLNASHKTKFIVHGFMNSIQEKWVKNMKDELLKSEDMNVIAVDWSGGSKPSYTQATANTRLVGMEIAHLINYLVENHNVNPKNVHIIGHSLGAHTAGYAGALVPNLGRITGLDPAEPYFQGMPTYVRLDPSDAELVDVIHTDGKSIIFLGFGMAQPCGHLDFYPNNGKEQPGCDATKTPIIPLTLMTEDIDEAYKYFVECSHIRAVKLFIESINSPCPFIGSQCSSYEDFMAGKCFECKPGSTSCAIMGYHADSNLHNVPSSKLSELLGKKYFLTTDKEFPYCTKQYRVNVTLAKPKDAASWVQGTIQASIETPTKVAKIDLTDGNVKLQHGTTYSTVLSIPTDLTNVKVQFTWKYEATILDPKSICIFCNNHLYVESVSFEELKFQERRKREVNSNKLCPGHNKQYSDIASGETAIFMEQC